MVEQRICCYTCTTIRSRHVQESIPRLRIHCRTYDRCGTSALRLCNGFDAGFQVVNVVDPGEIEEVVDFVGGEGGGSG